MAIYPLYNVPSLTEEVICSIFDFTEKQREKMHFRHENDLPAIYCFDDITRNEVRCERSSVEIDGGQGGLIACQTSQGIMFLDRQYLAPISDVPWNQIEIFERQTESGKIYFAVKSGLLLLALVMPYDAINEEFVDELKQLYEQCNVTLFNKKLHKREVRQINFFEEGEET